MLIGAGVSLVPILNFAMTGYSLDVLRNTSRGQDVPLPSWNDLGRQFIDGLKLFVVQLIYSIPILVLVFGLLIVSIGFGITSDNVGRGAVRTMESAFAVFALAVSCVAFLYGLVIGFLTPALYILVARTGDIGAAFRFNEIGDIIRRNGSDYWVVALVPLVFAVVLALVITGISIVPFVGVCISVLIVPIAVLLSPYVQIVLGHLYGQLVRV
jgi:hypothetical protein